MCGEKSSGKRVRNPQLETNFNSLQVSNLRLVAYCLRVFVSLRVKYEYNFYSTFQRAAVKNEIIYLKSLLKLHSIISNKLTFN